MSKGLMALLTSTLLLASAAFIIQSADHRSTAMAQTITLDQTNMLYLSQEVSTDSVHEIMEKAHALDQDAAAVMAKTPIYLVLNTPGGDVQAGRYLAEYLRGLRRPVHTITIFAASMGFHLVQELGTRYMLEAGTLMSHRPRGGISGEFGGLDGSQLDQRYNFYKAAFTEMDEQVVKRTQGKQSLRSYREAYENEMWRTTKQAVEEGYADEMVLIRCGDTGGTITHTVDFFGMKFTAKMSSCPLDQHIEVEKSDSIPANANIPDDLTALNRSYLGKPGF